MLRAGVIIVQQFLSRIMDLLCACPPGHVPCLAVTGAGGKSSLAAGLSIHLSKAGHSGIIAPSTRIYMPRPRSCSPEEEQRLAECGTQTCDALLLRRGRSDRALSEELRAVLCTMDGVPGRAPSVAGKVFGHYARTGHYAWCLGKKWCGTAPEASCADFLRKRSVG